MIHWKKSVERKNINTHTHRVWEESIRALTHLVGSSEGAAPTRCVTTLQNGDLFNCQQFLREAGGSVAPLYRKKLKNSCSVGGRAGNTITSHLSDVEAGEKSAGSLRWFSQQFSLIKSEISLQMTSLATLLWPAVVCKLHCSATHLKENDILNLLSM